MCIQVHVYHVEQCKRYCSEFNKDSGILIWKPTLTDSAPIPFKARLAFAHKTSISASTHCILMTGISILHALICVCMFTRLWWVMMMHTFLYYYHAWSHSWLCMVIMLMISYMLMYAHMLQWKKTFSDVCVQQGIVYVFMVVKYHGHCLKYYMDPEFHTSLT